MRAFKNVVKSIKRSEKDVDKVLKAARLQRCPKEQKEIDDFWYFLVLMIACAGIYAPLFITLMR